MKINNKLKNEILSLESIHTLVQSYQEIAATRMRKVRNSVLQNRDFLEGLNNMYANISDVYMNEMTLLIKKNKNKDIKEVRKNNGKTVSVYLSANTGLYGNIIHKTFNKFVKDVRESDTDIVIVGRYGRKMYENTLMKKDFVYFDFSDSGMDEENTKKILTHVLQYKNINVYHGYFQNVLSQIAKVTPVTGKNTESDNSREDKNVVRYIFEPSIEGVMGFFEKEILTAIFGQSVFESSLSKFASRMISLDYAAVNIKNQMKQSNFKITKLKHRLSNSAQLNLLSSISLWGN